VRCVLDTETTGKRDNPRARVVEVGAVAIGRDGHVVSTFQSVVHPEPFDEGYPFNDSQRVPVEAILGARGEAEVRREFTRWRIANDIQEVWSFNRSFDEEMLKRSGYVLPWEGCVMNLARAHLCLKKTPSLVEAAKHLLGEDVTPNHRALDDARLAARILLALRR
jgi:DNA polymerase III epsilon subunit-like protein